MIPIGTPMTDDNGKKTFQVSQYLAVPRCLESEISKIVEKTIGATFHQRHQ